MESWHVPLELGLAAAAVWGAIWGSFFNVVIYRLPLGLSLVRPASRCGSCETPLRAWHNVPILSWILLRGRCAFCKASISMRYPFVELLCACLAVATWVRFVVHSTDPLGGIAAFVLEFFFVGALVVIVYIDLDYRIIPHIITLPFMIVGVALSFLLHPHTGVTWQDASIGVLLGAGTIWLVIQLYYWVRKREGMGGGDFMMMGMLGAWLGYESIVFVFFAASLQGTLVAIVLFVSGARVAPPKLLPEEIAAGVEIPEPEGEGFRYMEMPFGPFLTLAGLEWFFFAPWIREVLYGLYGM